jgi:hypothetical protein
MDFDSSLDIVNGEISPKCLPNIWADMQDLPATGLVTLCGDGFAESQHQQPPHDVACLSSTAYQHFTGAAQDANEFETCAIDPTYSTRGYGKSFMSVDVLRLIHGEHLFFPATLWRTLANTNAKKSYKGHVVTTRIRHSTEMI